MDIFKFSNIRKIGLVLSLLFSTSSFASLIVDVVYQDQALSGLGNSISYQHDITDDGFTFGSATSANLAIQVNNLSFWETLLFQIEEFDFDSGAITLGSGFIGDLEVNALAALNSNGLLDVFVYVVFWLYFVVRLLCSFFKFSYCCYYYYCVCYMCFCIVLLCV